jgi:23S rRNA (cytidine1920-2'-O)/16S rRNA (cytidine1409-2'-O)-methyltransferase
LTRPNPPSTTTSARPRKVRADVLLVERGLAESRARAQALIMAGRVRSGDRRIDKPGALCAADASIALSGKAHPWVSRGGVKLAHGLDRFRIDPAARICLDIGASTGGFTEVLLRRYLTAEQVPEPVDLIACDVSFIGLETVLPAPLALAAAGADLIALVKPQFEVGRGRVGKGGVVRDPALHREVCGRIGGWLTGLPGWTVIGLLESPILGPEGNKEFLIAGRRDRP